LLFFINLGNFCFITFFYYGIDFFLTRVLMSELHILYFQKRNKIRLFIKQNVYKQMSFELLTNLFFFYRENLFIFIHNIQWWKNSVN
jgi:hypothetical protein